MDINPPCDARREKVGALSVQFIVVYSFSFSLVWYFFEILTLSLSQSDILINS